MAVQEKERGRERTTAGREAVSPEEEHEERRGEVDEDVLEVE